MPSTRSPDSSQALAQHASAMGRFGPSVYYIPGVFAVCPLTWLGALLAVFRHSPAFRVWLWQSLPLEMVRDGMLAFFNWSVRLPVSIHLLFFGAAFLYSLVRYFTSSFAVDENGDLIVNTGLLGLGTPAGPYVEYQHTIPLAMVGEVDIRRNPVQFIFRTGTVIVTYRELDIDGHGHKGSARLSLPFILRPEQVRNAIMAGSQVHHARFIV